MNEKLQLSSEEFECKYKKFERVKIIESECMSGETKSCENENVRTIDFESSKIQQQGGSHDFILLWIENSK